MPRSIPARRIYETEDAPFGIIVKWLCPASSCVFCDYCSDVYWDYDNGPYMFICEHESNNTEEGYKGECKYFHETRHEERKE